MHTSKNITAIILAAGRGSRMKNLTDDTPKCMLELAGKRLLDWQLESLKKAKLEKIVVVCGYLAERFKGDFDIIKNPRWAETNMVSSLLCALEIIKDCTILISYSDIVYKSEHVTKALEAHGDICITYDTKWESLWRLRNEDPLNDAETFKQKNNLLLEIGQKAQKVEDIQGQYMGLLKITPQGQQIVKNYLATLENAKVDTLDMTSLLQALLQNNKQITVVPVNAGWCECDTQQDIFIYEETLKKNQHWIHDWR